MPARESHPGDAVPIDVHAARGEALHGLTILVQRKLVHLDERGLLRTLARNEPQNGPRIAEGGAPDRPVRRRRNGVEPGGDPLVPARVDRLVRLDVRVADPVAVRIEDERRPALGRLRVAGLQERSRIEPPDYLAAAARPERVVVVHGEHEVMRAEAGADRGVLVRAWIVHAEMPASILDRELSRRRVIRALAAEVGVLPWAHGRGDPHSALVVDHRIVSVRAAVPDGLVSEVRRGRGHVQTRRDGRSGVEQRQRYLRGRMRARIQDGDVIRAQLQRSVDGTVRVHGRITTISRDDVVQIRRGIGPVPDRDDHVTLDALRPRRRGRHRPRLDPVGPVREHLERAARPELRDAAHHLVAGLPREDATLPRLHRGIELAEARGKLSRADGAELVARCARPRLHSAQPIRLCGDVRGDPVSVRSRPREVFTRRHLDEREPRPRGVVVGGGTLVRRWNGGQVDGASRRRLHLLGVDQAVAPDPYIVLGVRKVRHEVASLVVGHDDPRKGRGQIARLRDHPDARLGS
jgi:hypothetical protein